MMNSIVVLVYKDNTEEKRNRLRIVLQCIKNQSVESHVIICYDFNTSAETLQLCKEFNFNEYIECPREYLSVNSPVGKIKYIYGLIKTKYVAFCDSDDYWLSNKIETQLNLMESTKAVFSASSFIHITDNVPNKIEIIATSNYGIINTTPSTYMFNKELIKDYPIDIDMPFAWDIGVVNKVLTLGNMLYISTPLIIYNTWNNNSGSSITDEERNICRKKLLVYLDSYKKKWNKIILK